MTDYGPTAISLSIHRLCRENGDLSTLTAALNRRDEHGNPKYSVDLKSDEHLAVVYSDDSPSSIPRFETEIRSAILEQPTLRPLAAQLPKAIMNEEAWKQLDRIDWSKSVVEKAYEGTSMMVFYHIDRWYVTTRRFLDASDSNWIKTRSYRQMFEEAIADKFSIDSLEPDLIYHFILLHHLNKHIVSYTEYGKIYKEVILHRVTEKYTGFEVERTLPGALTVDREEIGSVDELREAVEKWSAEYDKIHRVKSEGFVVRCYDGEIGRSPCHQYKIQFPIYRRLVKMRPNNPNIHQAYLELYQRDQLREFIPFMTSSRTEIIKRINMAMRNMATEILNLYHGTRKKRHPEVYTSLSDTYRRVLYGLHGIYIDNRKQMNLENVEESKSASITVHDVYFFIKSLPPEQLRQLFFERWMLLNDEEVEQRFFNRDDMYIQVQTILMYKHLLDLPKRGKKETLEQKVEEKKDKI